MAKPLEKKKFKFHLKSGDQVMVVSGSNKGQTGTIRTIDRKKYRAIVTDVNIVSKHTKPNAEFPEGGIIKQEAPIHMSNLMLVDPKSGKPTRVGRKKEGDKLVRYAKKSGEVID